MKRLNTAAVGLGAMLACAPAWAYETEMLVASGPSANRINIILMGDGYRTEDQALLTERASSFVGELWSHPAFGEYRNYFNVKLIHTVSADDGAINGANPPSQPTIFGSYFNCSNIDRLLCLGDGAKVYEVLAADAPEYDSRFDLVLVLVNDAKYGGAGGGIATASAAPSAAEIAVHELGHSFGSLGDEYVDPAICYTPSTDPYEPNITIEARRDFVKWNVWIEPSTPVPTPAGAGYDNAVGLFEGARCSTGQYRPWETCQMRELGRAFCPVCTESLIWNIYDKVDPIDTSSPATETVGLATDGSQVFSYAAVVPGASVLSSTWGLDGSVVATGSTSYVLNGAGLSAGQHTLTLTVHDQTTRARRDPDGVLSSSHTWTINVAGGLTTGSISWQKWTGLASGTATSGVPVNTTPTSSGTYSSFEAPLNTGDRYGLRVRGYLVPPMTGSYVFWVAADDAADLYLGSSSDPASKTRIAYTTSYTNSRQWTKYTSQKSSAITLFNGSPYYIEAVMRENSGNDNLAVGWAKPGQGTSSPSQVIPGSALAPFGNGSGGSSGSGGAPGSGGTGSGGSPRGGSATGGSPRGGSGTGGAPSGGFSSGGSARGGSSSGGAPSGGSGTGGSTGSEPCTPARTISGGQTGNFGTAGPYCFRTADAIHGWGCSNFSGRTLLINDVPTTCGAMPLPATVGGGYYYFESSAGSYDYASIYWW